MPCDLPIQEPCLAQEGAQILPEWLSELGRLKVFESRIKLKPIKTSAAEGVGV